VKKIACSSLSIRVSHDCGDAEVDGEGVRNGSSAKGASSVTVRR
jgi:hypothetical protein